MMHIPEIKMNWLDFATWDNDDPVGLRIHIFNTYGDISKFNFGPIVNYYFMHPDHAQIILSEKQDAFFNKHPFLVHGLEPVSGTVSFLTQNDPCPWKKNRDVGLKPLDTNVYFHRYVEKFYEIAMQRIGKWAKKYEDKDRINIGRELSCLISSFVNNSYLYYIEDTPEDTVDMMYNSTVVLIGKKTSTNPAEWDTPIRMKRYEEGIAHNRETYRRWVRKRLSSGLAIDDYLGFSLHECSKESTGEELIEKVSFQLATVSATAFFTTVPSIQWFLIELARHPEVVQKIREEIRQVIGENPVTYDLINKLTYTTAALKESMRLNPSSFNQLREAVIDTSVKNYFIPKGSGIILTNYIIHRHPDFWKDPDTYNPDRFLEKPLGQDHPYAYLPFGGGKRACIARHFVFAELLTALAVILPRFSFELVPNKPIRPVMTSPFTMRPNENELIIRVP